MHWHKAGHIAAFADEVRHYRSQARPGSGGPREEQASVFPNLNVLNTDFTAYGASGESIDLI